MADPEDIGATGLSVVPKTKMLHQAHQARSGVQSGELYTLVYSFTDPDFGQDNSLNFQAIPMVVSDMWLEFDLTRTTSQGYLPPPQFWLGANGIQLLYNEQEFLRMGDIQGQQQYLMNEENMMRQRDHLNAQPDFSNANLKLYYGDTTTPTTLPLFARLRLAPFANVLKNAGPLMSYASLKWGIRVNLKDDTTIVQGAAATVAMNSMKIYISGHREDAKNVSLIAQHLALQGVMMKFLAPYTQTQTVSDTTTATSDPDLTFSFPSVDGCLAGIVIALRNNTLYTASAATRDRRSWINTATPTASPYDTNTIGSMAVDSDFVIGIGTTGEPTAVYGKEIHQMALRNLVQQSSIMGSSLYYTADNRMIDTGIIFIPLAEKLSLSNIFGADTGSLRIHNDFQITFRWLQDRSSGGGSVPLKVDVLLLVEKTAVVLHEGAKIVNAV